MPLHTNTACSYWDQSLYVSDTSCTSFGVFLALLVYVHPAYFSSTELHHFFHICQSLTVNLA